MQTTDVTSNQPNGAATAQTGGFLTRLNERDGYIRRFSRRIGRSKAAELERFIKFLFIGALGAIIDLGITNLLMALLHVQDGDVHLVILAGSTGFTLAVCSNFFWNRYWTYPDSRSRSVKFQLAQFFLVSFIGLLIRAGVLALLSNAFTALVKQVTGPGMFNLGLDEHLQFKLGANMAVMLALVIVALWNFVVNRFWTYGDVK